ncbi:hypothetical protein LTR85_006968 [Meristemomyces frigidus]|nr:hypothetical protein LTR85_006968 [Meristemomyces frigidus]
MLAPSRCTDYSTHGFLPTVPSPLSPRSTNIYGRRPLYMSSDAVTKEERKIAPTRFTPQRPTVKKAPVPKQDELKERRRSMFLKKVREGREEKRWESRGEDMMRLDFMQRQRQWEAEQAREAPPLPQETVEEDEEVYELPNASSSAMPISAPPSQQAMPDAELDEVLQREDLELEALLSYMPELKNEDAACYGTRSDHMWSDDDDYDALFSELVDQNDHERGLRLYDVPSAHAPQYALPDEADEAMDLF